MYYFLAIIVCAIWGATFVSSKILLNAGLSPAMVFFLRFLLAYMVTVVVTLPLSFRKMWCDSRKDEITMLVAGMSGGSMYFLTENFALLYTQSAHVSFMTSLPPLFLVIFAVLRPGGSKGHWTIWLGMLLAVLGLVCFVLGADPEAAPNPLLGIMIALVSALLWRVYQVVVDPMSEKYGTLMVTRKVFGYGLLTILPFVVCEVPELPDRLVGCEVWFHLLFLGLLASLFCFYMWNVIIKKIGSVTSANFLYLNPFVTCVASYFLLGEQIRFCMILGGAFTIAGVYLGLKNSDRNI